MGISKRRVRVTSILSISNFIETTMMAGLVLVVTASVYPVLHIAIAMVVQR